MGKQFLVITTLSTWHVACGRMRRLSSLDMRWKFICIASARRWRSGLLSAAGFPRFQDRRRLVYHMKPPSCISQAFLTLQLEHIYAPAANFWATSLVGRYRRDESTVFPHVRVAALLPLKGWKITSQVIIKRSLRTTLVVLVFHVVISSINQFKLREECHGVSNLDHFAFSTHVCIQPLAFFPSTLASSSQFAALKGYSMESVNQFADASWNWKSFFSLSYFSTRWHPLSDEGWEKDCFGSLWFKFN